MPLPPPCGSNAGPASTVVDEVHQHVVAQLLAVDEKRPPAVEAGEALDEVAQVVVGLEHEAVDGNTLLGAALDFHQGAAEGLLHRRVSENHAAAVVEVSGWLAIGDHDDLLVSAGVL